MKFIRPKGGFSLVELLIAMTLGLLVTGIAAMSFQGSARSAELGLALVELQSRARFALDEISRGVRSAGFTGCAGAVQVVPALPERLSEPASERASWQPVDGHVFTGSAWSPAAPQGYGTGGYVFPTSGFAAPVAGTAGLLLEGGIGPGGAVQPGATGASTIVVTNAPYGLARGSMAMIGDCSRAEVFYVDSVSFDTGGTATLTPVEPLLHSYPIHPDYPSGTRVFPYRRALYYVGQTGRLSEQGEPIRALFEHLHPYLDNAPTELAGGVEAMVVRYQQRADSGQAYETSAQAADFDPALVVGIRMGLLLSQDAYRPPGGAAPVYVLAGLTATADATGAAPGFPDDGRMRRTFERTTAVRARNQVFGL